MYYFLNKIYKKYTIAINKGFLTLKIFRVFLLFAKRMTYDCLEPIAQNIFTFATDEKSSSPNASLKGSK